MSYYKKNDIGTTVERNIGKIVGGAVGFIFGGPVGAAIGAGVGHYAMGDKDGVKEAKKAIDKVTGVSVPKTVNYASMDSFYAKLTGVTYDNRQSLISRLQEGTQLYLEREKNNSYDENAIKVNHLYNGTIGYLPKDVSCYLASLIDNGEKYNAVVSKITGGTDGNYYGVNIHLSKVKRASVSYGNYNNNDDDFDSYEEGIPDGYEDYFEGGDREGEDIFADN